MNLVIRHGELVVRVLFFLFLGIIFLNFSGCNTLYRNYVSREINYENEAEKARAIHGSINVILLPGYSETSGNEDTLYRCLKLSRDVNPESVKLPPDENLYLGHVTEFILRTLKHYQLQENFRDFYGCRIILKFRKLSPQEIRSRKFAHYSRFALKTVGMVAGMITLMPVNAILFVVNGVKTEMDRQKIEDHALKMGLPRPKKGTILTKLEEGERNLLSIKDEIDKELTGNTSTRLQFNNKVSGYLIEECILEKATSKEIALYQQQVQHFKNLN